ncbi:MAG TPA: response regulator, partial [Steroidobacteraceae bacterium]
LPDFDCLILDIAMPDMSGPELQRELVRRGQGLPVIFITGHADAGVRSILRRQGAVEVLNKPFSEGDLLSALKAALPHV